MIMINLMITKKNKKKNKRQNINIDKKVYSTVASNDYCSHFTIHKQERGVILLLDPQDYFTLDGAN
jgi:hypothetical protein